jgi:hypothetical protein
VKIFVYQVIDQAHDPAQNDVFYPTYRQAKERRRELLDENGPGSTVIVRHAVRMTADGIAHALTWLPQR